jgi:RimJ/RimL family protein N-acetyltransferase
MNESTNNYLFGIFDYNTEKHIGNIKLGLINPIHKYAEVGLVIGDKSFWGKGIGTEAIKLVVEFAFNTLLLNKVTAGIYSNNIASLKAFQKLGFEIEGHQKKQFLFNGQYIDRYLVGKINISN